MRNSPVSAVALLALALLPAPAGAVHLDPQGLGQVLIYPYYTVNAGHATLISVVNTTAQAKAIKVRFREAVKGRSVLDFNLYLAPFDVYTAALTASGETDPARLLSVDASCTVPLPAAEPGANFGARTLTYAGPADGPAGVERSREGWIELIEMGVVEDVPAAGNIDTSFFAALLPQDGRPAGCDRLVAAWNGGVWSANATRAASGPGVGVGPPRGGLYGGGVIADVAEGVAYGYSAEAIDGFYLLSETQLHTPPGSASPDLASAQTRPGRAQARIYADGRAIDLDFVAGRPDAVSAVLMGEQLFNEFNVSASLAADSEWVVTFPTRHLHQAQPGPARRRPFVAADSACEPFFAHFYDREAGPDAPLPEVEDLPAPRSSQLCYHAQVLRWGGEQQVPSPLLASRLVADAGTRNTLLLLRADGSRVPAGHATFGFPTDRFLIDGEENAGQAPRQQVFGLPVSGFWAANYVNLNARPGLLANYSVGTRHRLRSRVRPVLVAGEGTPDETITPVAGR